MNEPIPIIKDTTEYSKIETNYLPETDRGKLLVKVKRSKKTHKKLRIINSPPPTIEEPLISVLPPDLSTQNTSNTPITLIDPTTTIHPLSPPLTLLSSPLITPPPPPPPPQDPSSPPPLINKTRKNKKIISPNEKAKLWELFDIHNQVQSVEIGDIEKDDKVGKIPLFTEATPDTITTPNDTPDVSKTPDNPFRNIDPPTPPPPPPSPTSSSSSSPVPPESNKYEMYNIRHICQKCDSVLLIMEDGVPTCINPKCGIIYKDVIDYSPEWKFYGCGNGDNKHTTDITRCGNPINPLLIESSFGCKILCNNNSSFEMKRIRKWTEWTSTPHREKSLYEEFLFITTMAHNSGIPKIFIDYAMMIHKDISEQKMFRGMNRDGIKAASIYISCRLNGCPRTAHEIAEIFKLDKQSTTLGCSNAIKILNNIERNVEHSNKSEFKTTTASSFIERYCCKLGISQELTLLSKFIAIKTEQTELLCNNTPQSSAAGIIQFISQTFHLGISKISIKSVCGVSEVTIGKCCKKMESIKEQLIPKSMMVKYGLS
jgi:transcription initiation factor TFIIB